MASPAELIIFFAKPLISALPKLFIPDKLFVTPFIILDASETAVPFILANELSTLPVRFPIVVAVFELSVEILLDTSVPIVLTLVLTFSVITARSEAVLSELSLFFPVINPHRSEKIPFIPSTAPVIILGIASMIPEPNDFISSQPALTIEGNIWIRPPMSDPTIWIPEEMIDGRF